MLEEKIRKNIAMYGDTNQERIECCKQFLNDTDYVVIKMSEVMAEGGSVEALKSEYANILVERENARAMINELEGEV